MKLIDCLNFIKDINEKLYNNDAMERNLFHAKYYETLHASMVEFLKNFTEKEFNEISLMLRKSIERLEKDLLFRCGKEYREDYNLYLKENSKFKIESDKSSKMKTKCKNQIGFEREK